jgi:glycosyltransferase involved in cell wall biosynthesis
MVQDYSNLEQIVVDGNSTDETLEVVRSFEGRYPLTLISEPDRGQSDAVNKGFRMARGDFLGWINSDDMYFDRGVLSFVASTFRRLPDVDVVYGDQVAVDEWNRVLRVGKLFEWNYAKIRRGCALSQPATFFRSKVTQTNTLNLLLEHAMDLDYWLRLGESYNFLHVNRILAAFRVHDRAKSTAQRPLARNEARQVLLRHGREFGCSYWVPHLLVDLPAAAVRRTLGLYDCLRMPREEDNLAFPTHRGTAWQMVLRQLWPFQKPPPIGLFW